jgi:nucleoside-diphosphate-sugar epimerase
LCGGSQVKTLKTSVLGTLNMLGLAKRVKARFLLTSTSEVYGDPLQHPQTEEYWGNVNPIGERSCYDEGKRVAETCVDPFLRVRVCVGVWSPWCHASQWRQVLHHTRAWLSSAPSCLYAGFRPPGPP